MADSKPASFIPEGDAILAERHRLRQVERAPGTAESVQTGFGFLNLGSARVHDFELNGLLGRRRVDGAVGFSHYQLPLRGLPGPIGGSIGKGINPPQVLLLMSVVAVTKAEGLAIVVRRNNQEVLGVVRSKSQIEDRQAIAIRLFGALSHSPAAIGETGFPQLYLRASNGRAIESIT